MNLTRLNRLSLPYNIWVSRINKNLVEMGDRLVSLSVEQENRMLDRELVWLITNGKYSRVKKLNYKEVKP